VCAPEPAAAGADQPGARLRRCLADIVQLSAVRERISELQRIAGGRGVQLAAPGSAALAADALTADALTADALTAGAHAADGHAADVLALCVRPQRWLLLGAPASPGASAGRWQAACAGVGAAVDLSSGLTALHLAGASARELLLRACRLDLDAQTFPTGSAAATSMVQVSVILAALPSGLLLLTPSSTARHFREWLAATGRPFGLELQPDVSLVALLAEAPPPRDHGSWS
jgi:heterotetrameric sarcosine oxidase gamma subunit